MFWERFDDMCNKNGTRPNPLCKSIGIASGTVTSWKYGKLPNGENLIKIANCLRCSIDYLLGRTDNPNISAEAYIGGDNNGVQAVKNGTVTISQSAETEKINCKEIEYMLSKLSRSEQLRAIADIIDLLEEKYT